MDASGTSVALSEIILSLAVGVSNNQRYAHVVDCIDCFCQTFILSVRVSCIISRYFT